MSGLQPTLKALLLPPAASALSLSQACLILVWHLLLGGHLSALGTAPISDSRKEKLDCKAVPIKGSSDLMGSSGPGMALQSSPILRQEG